MKSVPGIPQYCFPPDFFYNFRIVSFVSNISVGCLKTFKTRKLKQIVVICLLLIGGLNLSANKNNDIPFTSTKPPFFYPLQEPGISKITDFNYTIQNNRVLLSWTVKANEDSDQFEVERSNDGKIFTMAALVFGTDKPDTDYYKFFEKVVSTRMYYRIKILHKDETISYSDTITVNAGI